MNLETRARDAAEHLRAVTPVDADDRLRRLHRTHRRRTTSKVVAAVAAVAVGVGVAQIQLGQDRAAQPASPPWVWPSGWVLVGGSGAGGADNPVQPVGDEWAVPLTEQGFQRYPNFRSADPATRRFLVQSSDATAWIVMTPGQGEPLATIYADFGTALGPGPDEVTAPSSDLERLVVIGPDGQIRRTVGAAWTPEPPKGGFSGAFAWSPDGETWAETRHEFGPDAASLTVVLRDPDSPEETTLYEYSEAAPRWYDVEEHRFGDGPGAFNSWGAPPLVDLQWAPGSTQLAFARMTTPEGAVSERRVEWQLFVADAATGDVAQIADLGRCAEPVDEDGRHARVCDEQDPALAWTPDGTGITVLTRSTLTTYDRTGKVLSSEPTDLNGPIAWMTAK